MITSLQDVAKFAGVSQNTVSRALRGMPDISQNTTERIRKVADMMGYKPNGASRALRYQMFHSVGVLTGVASEYYLPQITLGAVSQALAKNGYSCSVVFAPKMDVHDSPLLKSRLVDSLLVAYIHDLSMEVMDSFTKTGIPIVWLNRWLEKDCLTVDEGQAVVLLMEHLCEYGYDDVMYVDYSTGGEGWIAPRRLFAFDSAAERLNMKVSRMAHRRVAREERAAVTRTLLSKPDRPRAIIAGSITAAQVIMMTALQMGLRIPEDLALASFDDGVTWTVTTPSITCAIRPEFDFGTAAAEMAMAKARNPKEPLPNRSVQYTLAIGGSTAAGRQPVQ